MRHACIEDSAAKVAHGAIIIIQRKYAIYTRHITRAQITLGARAPCSFGMWALRYD